MARLLLLNGPNLNLLGSREPEIYGKDTLASIEERLRKLAGESGHELSALQSNAEHELIERVHAAAQNGSPSSSSIPVRSATRASPCVMRCWACALPFIEVHLSNPYARESFRKHSYFSDIASGCIFGLGALGYELALRAAIRKLQT